MKCECATKKPCACDPGMRSMIRRDDPRLTRDDAGHWLCATCGGYEPCEFGYLDEIEHPADRTHVDYIICEKHERAAVDNVGSRTW